MVWRGPLRPIEETLPPASIRAFKGSNMSAICIYYETTYYTLTLSSWLRHETVLSSSCFAGNLLLFPVSSTQLVSACVV